MKISPSDMDVGQGYSLTEDTTDTQNGTAAASSETTDAASGSEDIDARSKTVAAAADKTLARETAQSLSDRFSNGDTGLKIRVLDDADRTVQVEVVNEQTNKVLRKIPEDEMIKLAASYKAMTGVIVNKPA